MSTKGLLVCVVCSLLFLRNSIVAQSLTLSSSAQGVDINTVFEVTVQVDEVTTSGDLQIVGLENFTVRSQAKSTRMQLIDGKQSVQVVIQLQLQPMSAGSFVLGPVQIQLGSGILESNTLTIEVTGEKLFLQPQQVNTLLGPSENSPDESTPEELPSAGITQTSYRSRRWWFLILVGCGAGGLFLSHKTRRNAYTKKHDSLVSQKELLPDSFPLPASDAVDFREQHDRWWRMQLMILLDTDCRSATSAELSLLIHQLPQIALQEIYIDAFHLIQQARYTNSEVNREEMSELIDRFLFLR